MRRGGGCERCAQTRLVGAHSVCPFQELLSLLDELPDDAAYGVVLFRRQLVLVVFSSVHKPVLTLYLFVKNVSEVLRCQKILKSTNPEQNQACASGEWSAGQHVFYPLNTYFMRAYPRVRKKMRLVHADISSPVARSMCSPLRTARGTLGWMSTRPSSARQIPACICCAIYPTRENVNQG